MHIIVSPPLWATWYAKTIYILLVLFIMYFIFRSYKKRLLLKSSLEIEKTRGRQKEEADKRAGTKQRTLPLLYQHCARTAYSTHTDYRPVRGFERRQEPDAVSHESTDDTSQRGTVAQSH